MYLVETKYLDSYSMDMHVCMHVCHIICKFVTPTLGSFSPEGNLNKYFK